MSVLNYNLNLLTMMALTLSVGILVDDSIVVLENIYRHLDMGKPPLVAAIDGRGEIGLAALTITLVDVVVYLPIAIMLSGVSAQFLRPFALTIAIATLASLAGLVHADAAAGQPLPEARGRARARSPLARFGRAWDRGFICARARYEGLLQHALPPPLAGDRASASASFAFGIAPVAHGADRLGLLPERRPERDRHHADDAALHVARGDERGRAADGADPPRITPRSTASTRSSVRAAAGSARPPATTRRR